MTESVQLVFADFQFLIWIVIIVGSLIAQAVKSRREKQNPSPPGAPPKKKFRPPVFTDAQADLEDFLENLSRDSGQPLPEKTPAGEPALPQEPSKETVVTGELPRRPPPVPPAPSPTSLPRNVMSPEPVPRFKRPELAVARAETPLTTAPGRISPRAPLPSVPQDDIQPFPTARQQGPQKIRTAIGSDLIDRNALRKAILLQEILNKPLALRTDKEADSR
jgi:hypothetical protein